MEGEIGDALRRMVVNSVKNMTTAKITADDYYTELALAA
jgi:hypothetical protein